MRILLLLFTLAGVSRADILFSEDFNHNGALPAGWTIESRAQAARTQYWAPYNQGSGDWAMRTLQVNLETPYDEWLISPVLDATGWADLSLSLNHVYMHGNSQARLRYSTNGGSTWATMSTWNNSTSGPQTFDISAVADGQLAFRLAFVFAGNFVNSGANWMVDNLVLQGQGATDQIPPLAETPVPLQPMEDAWGTLSGQVGCTFHDASGVDASTVQVRIDANNDGDYLDGGAESWNAVTGLLSGVTVEVLTTVSYGGEGLDQAFEFRARDLSSSGLWAYSGGQHLEGMADDWCVNIFYDYHPPQFRDPVPAGLWQNTREQNVTVTVYDPFGTVDASSLAMRVDFNRDGVYSGAAEDWQALWGYLDATSIQIQEAIHLPDDGSFAVEIRAFDTLGNGPAFSMGAEGPVDDILLQADTTPPTVSVLYPMGSTATSATLAFSPTTDDTFSYYEFYLDTTETVDELDTRIGPEQLPELAQQGTFQITLNQLAFGRQHWFRLRAVDQLGHVGLWSNTVSVLLEGVAPAAVSDLHIQRVEGGFQLSWTAPTTDVNGGTPLEIEGYKVWQLDPATGQPLESLATVATPSVFLPFSFATNQTQLLAVTVLGSGSTAPPRAYPGTMVRVPAGTFMMGQVGVAEPVHQVTLAQDFYLSQTEVTESQYRAAALWAIEQGLVQFDGSSLSAHGQYLSGLPGESNHPMIYITWYGAACYSDWLSLMEGRTPYYNGNWEASAAHNPYNHDGYRLPTEAEWEYAARYSDGRTYPWGNTSPTPCVHANFDVCVGWTSPVGSYPAGISVLGLQDMAGNVWEWVNDWYGGYPTSPSSNPYGNENWYSYRVIRGGGWYVHAFSLPCAYRSDCGPSHPDNALGFRLCRTLP